MFQRSKSLSLFRKLGIGRKRKALHKPWRNSHHSWRTKSQSFCCFLIVLTMLFLLQLFYIGPKKRKFTESTFLFKQIDNLINCLRMKFKSWKNFSQFCNIVQQIQVKIVKKVFNHIQDKMYHIHLWVQHSHKWLQRRPSCSMTKICSSMVLEDKQIILAHIVVKIFIY